jgi:hypothetical protein
MTSSPKSKSVAKGIFAVLIALTAIWLLLPFNAIYMENDHYCEITLSSRSGRQWPWGIFPGMTRWDYQKSNFHIFLEEHLTENIEHDWRYESGVGYNLYRRNVVRSSGAPRPILSRILDEYRSGLSSEEQVALYDKLHRSDPEQRRQIFHAIAMETLQK